MEKCFNRIQMNMKSLVLALLLMGVVIWVAIADPSVPTAYNGYVKANGLIPMPNTLVTVYANGAVINSTTSNSDGSYLVMVPWVSGETITFVVSGKTVNTTVIGAQDQGNYIRLNLSVPTTTSVPATVNLGTAGNFVILSETGITDTGSHTSAITGDIGTSPITGAAIGLTCAEVTGIIYTVDAAGPACGVADPAKLTAAVNDMYTAYTAAAGRTNPTATELYSGNLGGRTLAPGLYKWSTGVTIPTDVTLLGNSNDVWIFQISGDLNIASGGSVPSGIKVILAGGAQASNVFWQVGGPIGATLGTYSTFNGNILSAKQIIIQTGAVLDGRALAQTQVTLDANVVTFPYSIFNGALRGMYIKNGTSIGVSGARVNITNSKGSSVNMTTDTSGTYSVSLNPGRYTINVSKTGYSSNSTSAIVTSNSTTTVPTISLSLNTVAVTANRTVGTASTGQNVSFNLTVVNTGDNATFNVATSVTNASTNVTNTTTPIPLLLTTNNPTGYVVITVNNSNFGGWPVTITITNSSQSKSASITLNAIMSDSSANYTNISSTVTNATVVNATLVNATVQNGANVSGDSTLISDANITGSGTSITDGSVIKGTYADSTIDNSTIGNATVESSDLTRSNLSDNASITNSTLTDATVDNSTLTNVTVTSMSTITDVANLTNIIIRGVDVKGLEAYDYEGELQGSSSAGSVEYQGINFTKVYTDVRISQLVIEQSTAPPITSNTNTSINDTSLGTSMNFSMIVNLTRGMVINISETGISPDGVGLPTGTQLGHFLFIRSNDTNESNVTSNTLRLYFDTAPSTFTTVAIYYYNNATSKWEDVTTGGGTEGGRYYREAKPNHFSTFALLGTTTTGGGGNPGSGGGGGTGGGGGVVSGESFGNIAMYESYDKDLVANTPVTYTFKAPELGVYEIAVTDTNSENGITLRVELLKGTSTQVTAQPPGTVYKNINIIAGTSRMKEALIRFRVENSWLGSNSLAGSDVKLLHWESSQWTQLETAQTTKDDTYTYYEAKTTSLSPFAISGIKGGVLVPTATPVVTETQVMPTGTPSPSPTKKVPGFEFVLTVGILSVAYLFGRKRR